MEFTDINRAWLESRVSDKGGHWLADVIRLTIGGRRVHMAHLSVLLHLGQPVTSEALTKLGVYSRCPRPRCVNPVHFGAAILTEAELETREYKRALRERKRETPEARDRRAEAFKAAMARMAALRATSKENL